MLSYRYTGDKTMIALSKRTANYFLNRLPDDYVCHWDLALLGTDALRDSSSAAIAVCGLLELVKQLPVTDPDRERYLDWAKGIMSSLTKHYLMGKRREGNGLLKHAVYHRRATKAWMSVRAGAITTLRHWCGSPRAGSRTGKGRGRAPTCGYALGIRSVWPG